MAATRTLDLGCGPRKHEGAIGLDHVGLPGVDVLAEIEGAGLPFQAESFDRVYAHHVLEHVRDLTGVMAELRRICRPDAVVAILVPYFTCVGAFGDPTHVRFFTYYTFDHFTEQPELHTWFSQTRFHIRSRRIGFGRLHTLLGVAWFANRFPHIYENFLAFALPARTLQVELLVPVTRSNTP